MLLRRKSALSVVTASAAPETGTSYEALSFLTDQGLEHNPANFSLAWHIKTDRSSLTAIAVDAILMEGRKLSQADCRRLLEADAQRAKSGVEDVDPREDLLRHQTLRLADIAAGAVSQSSDFGRDLSSGLFELSGGGQSIEQIVKAMVHRTHGIEAELTAAAKEIDTLRQQVEMSRDDAQRDALTGLLNRRGALQELAARGPSKPAVVALCDIDHFKLVNDRFGHGVGDRVLKAVAESLSTSAGESTIARWGGEEFLIIVDGNEIEAAIRVLEHARKDLETRSFRIRTSGEPLGTVTMSVGAAIFSGTELDEAIEVADRMLYEAKRNGRNRVIFNHAAQR